MIQSDKTDLYQQFLLAITKGDLDAIVEVAYSYFKHPIIVLDPEYVLLAQVPPEPIGDYTWDKTLELGKYPPDVLTSDAIDYANFTSDTDGAVFLNWGIARNCPRLSSYIKFNGKVKAMMAVFFPEKNYTDDHYEAYSIFAMALSIYFSQDLNYYDSSTYMLKTFFFALLRGNEQDITYYSSWLSKMGIPILPQFCVVAAKPGKQLSETTAILICDQLHHLDPHPYVFRNEDWIYLLYSDIPDIKTYYAIQSDLKRADNIFHKNNLMLGISEVFTEIKDFSIYRYQAERALILGNQMRQTSKLQQYSDYIIKNILSYAKENMPPQNYIHPVLSILEKLDKENHSEYSKTLSVFLENMCNLTITREILHLHRNTLTYRLQKIESLTDINLSDHNTRLHLLFSLMMCNA